jgi:polyphosphate kinase 2
MSVIEADQASVEKPKLKRKEYEKLLQGLQAELCSLQDWVRASGERIIVVFEGRDAAGKGGTIRALTERVSPRTFRVVALPAPSDREKSQMYVQRYLMHFPAAGEIVIFDRSWYNRAGVEYVMGFCTKKQHRRFLEICPEIEKHIVDNGIRLIKYWLEVGNKEQKRRFEARIDDRIRQWKLSTEGENDKRGDDRDQDHLSAYGALRLCVKVLGLFEKRHERNLRTHADQQKQKKLPHQFDVYDREVHSVLAPYQAACRRATPTCGGDPVRLVVAG